MKDQKSYPRVQEIRQIKQSGYIHKFGPQNTMSGSAVSKSLLVSNKNKNMMSESEGTSVHKLKEFKNKPNNSTIENLKNDRKWENTKSTAKMLN